jgi:type VI protein secretion system component Hcp
MWMHWLRRQAQRFVPHHQPRRPIRTRSLHVEALEDRTLLSGMAMLQIDGLGTGPIAVETAQIKQRSAPGLTGPQTLTFSAAVGADSPWLLRHASDGMHFKDAVLTVPNDSSAMQWTLSDVSVTSFITDSMSDTFTLQFAAVHGQVVAPTVVAPVLTGQGTAPLEVLQFGGTSTTGIGIDPVALRTINLEVSQPPDMAGPAQAQPQDFRLQLAEGPQETKLLTAGADGSMFTDAFITVTADGTTSQWTLHNVSISSAQAGFANGGAGTDTVKLHFGAIQERVTTADGTQATMGWDFIAHQGVDLSVMNGTGKVSNPLVPTQPASLALQFAGFDHSLPIESFGFDESRPAGSNAHQVSLILAPTVEDPLLLLDAASGQVFTTAAVTINLGNQQVTWGLGNVSISRFDTGQGNGSGQDQLILQFDMIDEILPTMGATANAFTYDFPADTATVKVMPPKTLSSAALLPASAPQSETLQLVADNNFVLSADSYHWSIGAQVNKAGTTSTPQDFTIALPPNVQDGILMKATAAGGTYSEVVYTVVTSGYRIQWILTGAVVSSDHISTSAAGATDALTLHFGAIQESVTPTTANGMPSGPAITEAAWDFAGGQQPKFVQPPASVPVVQPLVFPGGPIATTLQADGLGTLDVSSLNWSESVPMGPQGPGIATPSDFVIGLTPGAVAPLLMQDVPDGKVFTQVVLTSQANGQQIQWALGNARITSLADVNGLGGDTETIDLRFTNLIESATVRTNNMGGTRKQQADWDFTTNKPIVNPVIGASTVTPVGHIPGPSPSILVNLTLTGANPALPGLNVSVPIDTFSWAELPAQGPATASDVTFLLQPSPAIETMLSATVGKRVGQVVLFAQGNRPTADWILGGAVLSSFGSGLGVGGGPDTFSIHFTTLQQSATPVDPYGMATGAAVSAGWDFAQRQAIPAAALAGTTTSVTSTGLSETFSSAPATVLLSAAVSAPESARGTVINDGTETFTILDSLGNVVATLPGNPVAGGVARASFVPAAPLHAGTYGIHAAYVPDTAASDFAPSADLGDGILTITPDSTSVRAITSVSIATHTTLYTQPATFTALVTPGTSSLGSEVDEGTVTFTVLDANGNAAVTLSDNPVGGGTASSSYDLAGLALGSYTVVATYVPDANADFTASTSSNFCGFGIIEFPILNLGQASTSITLTSTSLHTTAPTGGQTVSLAATVMNGDNDSVNEGTVTFTLVDTGGNIVATVAGNAVTAGSASVAYALPDLAAGTYRIQAAYVPVASNAAFTASSDSTDGTLTVAPAATTTTVTSTGMSATFATADQAVTLTAVVRSPNATINNGTVTFTLEDARGQLIGHSVTSDTIADGAASVTFALPGNTPAGIYTVHATYAPANDARFTGSSDVSPGTLIVRADSVVLSVDAPSPATAYAAAQTVLLSASVAPHNQSTGGTVSEGTVTFTVLDAHNHSLGHSVTSATIVNGIASAMYTLPARLPVGSYSIHAVYNPSATANFLSLGVVTGVPVLRVVPATTTTITSPSLMRKFSTVSEPVTLRAAIIGGPGSLHSASEGTITFTILDVRNQAVATLAANPVIRGTASVVYDLADLPAGTYHIHAVYVPAPVNTGFIASSDRHDSSLTILAAQRPASR